MSDRDRNENRHNHHARAVRAACLSVAAAAGVALAPSAGHAAVFSDTGWVQLQAAASDDASTTIAGYDFGIGYDARFAIEGYNWDVAPNTVSVSCVSLELEGLFHLIIPISVCPTLPGTKLSQTVATMPTTVNGVPATRRTTTIVWDVPDAGALARVNGSFAVPLTFFSQDMDLLKLTGAAVGDTNGPDTVSAQIFVVGSQIASPSEPLPFNKRLARRCVTLFDADAPFTLIGLPITVGASSEGCLNVDASASFVNRTLAGALTPNASVDATFTAGIGVDIIIASAQVGIQGNVTVIDASVPLAFSAAIGTSALTLTESGKLTMTGLDGEVDLFAEACALGACTDGSLKIFDWTGLTFVNATLFNLSQTLNF